jgi:hypothetical protein
MTTSVNTSQTFSKIGYDSWCKLQAANTATDGTGTLDAAGTATTTTGHLGTLASGGTSGKRIERLRFMAEGTNVASPCRLFLNNGSTNATAMNNTLIAEILLPATTASNSALINATIKELPTPATDTAFDVTAFPIVIPPGYFLMACLGTAVASFWDVTAIGGDINSAA